MADVAVLDILLYGEPIGTLTHVGGDLTLFAFNEAYIADENRPVLSLGFKGAMGQLIKEFRPYQTKVMPFFSNLLPEGRMRTYLAECAGVNEVREFFLLWALGLDLPGAITVVSADGEPLPPDNLHDRGDDDDDRRHALRFSLAGVQLKFSAVNQARGGLTIPAEGVGGSWIVKLPSPEFEGVPENEYSMMTLARLVGIDVPAIELVDIDTIGNLPRGVANLAGRALAIERFDRRSDGSAVHIEDFAQVFGIYASKKYENANARSIARVIAAEGTDGDIGEFIRRLTFNTLIGNGDMHLKNWSMIYPDRRTAALSPAYDFVSTIAYIPGDQAALKFSRTKRFDGYSEDELSHLAAKARLSDKLVRYVAQETVALFHQHWESEKANLPLHDDVVQAIETHLKTIPIA